MAQLEPSILTLLKKNGYSGNNTIEDVIYKISMYLFERGLNDINGESWWIYVKDQGMLVNKPFQRAIADKFIEIFKHG